MNAPRPDYTDTFREECSNCEHMIALTVPIETINNNFAWVECHNCSQINSVEKVVQ